MEEKRQFRIADLLWLTAAIAVATALFLAGSVSYNPICSYLGWVVAETTVGAIIAFFIGGREAIPIGAVFGFVAGVLCCPSWFSLKLFTF